MADTGGWAGGGVTTGGVDKGGVARDTDCTEGTGEFLALVGGGE